MGDEMSGHMRAADAHNDLRYKVVYQRERGYSDPVGGVWLPRLRVIADSLGAAGIKFLARVLPSEKRESVG